MSDDRHVGEDLVLLALGDGAPSQDAATRHAAHLAGCAECRGAVEEARRVMVALTLPAEAPSPAFDRALFARLDAIDAEARGTPWARLMAWVGGGAPWGRLSLAGGALAVVLVVAATVLTPGGDGAPGGAPGDDVASALAAVDDVELAENLDLLGDLELVEELDAIEDLEAIETLAEGSPG